MKFIEQVRHISDSYYWSTVKVAGLQALVVTDNLDYTLVSVRGTECKMNDIVRDMMFFPLYDKDTGFSHAGMSMGAHRLAKELSDVLEDKDKKIYLGGHSLGAGVSLLLVLELEHLGYNVERWVGLGTPKVEYADSYLETNAKLFSFRNGCDIVSYIPFEIMGYGLPCKITKIGKASKWWPNIEDHNIKYYIDAISKLGI